MKITLLSFLLSCSYLLVSQPKLSHVEPPFWWVGMSDPELQLMLHGDGIGQFKPEINYPGVTIQEVIQLENPNYLVLQLTIGKEAKSGSFDIRLNSGKKTIISARYELKDRLSDKNRNQGFTSADVIYLLMPDRFANGNPDNDVISGMLEGVDRSNPNARHGGDIKGVSDQLDYIKDLGMTAVWLTPTFENDMKPEYGAYHGYAATDLYAIDERFGSNEEFVSFVDKCHSMGLKVIMDMIHNHIGDQHWWMTDLPSSDWVHDYEVHGLTNFRGAVQSDPHASKHDFERLVKGWFVPELADLDQRNPVLANYLIQNSIWWIEYSGVDGIRMDTYVYPYKEYLSKWVQSVMKSYPKFNIVGEAWVTGIAHEAYWQQDKPNESDGYNSFLPSVTDFQLMFTIDRALKEPFDWTKGLSDLYYTISQDRLYSDPMKNVIFLDNHDIERILSRLGEDKELFKMAYGFLMTTRGIPQVYYGTELMMSNISGVQGYATQRADMLGGWKEDERSVFSKDDRTAEEQENLEYVSKLTNWRKGARAIHEGKLTHFIPENNSYVFFRHTDQEAVMVVMNRNDTSITLKRNRFVEFLEKYTNGVNVITGAEIDLKGDFEIGPKQTAIFDLKQ